MKFRVGNGYDVHRLVAGRPLIIGGVTTLILIGWAILLAASLWLTYRIVKGWLYLSEHRAMPH